MSGSRECMLNLETAPGPDKSQEEESRQNTAKTLRRLYDALTLDKGGSYESGQRVQRERNLKVVIRSVRWRVRTGLGYGTRGNGGLWLGEETGGLVTTAIDETETEVGKVEIGFDVDIGTGEKQRRRSKWTGVKQDG
ncbi:hypothetical protein NE237_031730 [Protea cynaroides]|uniref:Uncharacterized protein n=1 Tax=Protea cynaroides TaxID=273540 RepID=A0A9Q0R2F8_9MAGN|nr:hypothetical protein NE237_031730 [Protea cynaroides]